MEAASTEQGINGSMFEREGGQTELAGSFKELQ